MKSLLTAAALMLAALPAQAATVDSFNLDLTSAAGTNSNISLLAGIDYILTVSGTFEIGCRRPFGSCPADAEFFNVGFSGTDATSILEIGVGVDGQDINFGPFNRSNVYSSIITGLGAPINVFYSDTNYTDNSGSLQVQIATASPVPLPAGGLLLLSALGVVALRKRRSA